MTLTTKALTAAALLALAGCGTLQRLNPLTWFDAGSRPVPPASLPAAAPAVPLVAQVIALEVAPTPGGVIVSAMGLPPTQGFWDAELERVPSTDPATLVLRFRASPPPGRAPVGTVPSREILAGTRLTDADLAGIRTIAVEGQANRRLARR
jgi:hypothetical protein